MTARQRKIVERAEDNTGLWASLLVTSVLVVVSIAVFIPLVS